MRERLTFSNLCAMIVPPILYTMLTEICGHVLMIAGMFGLLPGVFYKMNVQQVNFAAAAVGAVVSIPVFLRMMDREELRHSTDYRYEKTINIRLLLAFILGILTALGMNRLLTLIRLDQWFPGYQETAEVLYSADLVWQILVLGLIVPAAEELLFRGVVYTRMKRCFSTSAAAIWCSLFFGIWHGNISQGIYAFLLGLLLIYVKEKYQTLLAPVLFHMGANLSSVLAEMFRPWDWSMEEPLLYPAFCVVELAVSVVILWCIEETVRPKRIKKNREWHREEKEPVDRNCG